MNIFQIFSYIFYYVDEYILILRKQIESLLITKTPENWIHGTKGNVILLPGFSETWVFLRTIAQYLNTLGFSIFVIHSLGRNVSSIETELDEVKNFINTHHLQNITLISHSKGGIIAKMLLDDTNYSKKITKSISIATPYGGSFLGYVPVFSSTQLIPGSHVVKAVRSLPSVNAKIINLYPLLDNHVIPNKHLLLSGAKNICINIVGHTRILEAKITIDTIVKNLHN